MIIIILSLTIPFTFLLEGKKEKRTKNQTKWNKKQLAHLSRRPTTCQLFVEDYCSVLDVTVENSACSVLDVTVENSACSVLDVTVENSACSVLNVTVENSACSG